MAECIVVGGNGFVGSHVVDELVAAGHTVTVFDRFSSSLPAYRSEGVRKIVGDFQNHAEVRNALEGQQYLFHFLSTTTPATSEDDPTLDVRTNIAASIDLFDQAADSGIQAVYFASTGGAIYGDQTAHSLSENVLPQPISPYAIGKLALEGYLRYFGRKRGLASVSFRISNPYGPRQRPNKKQGVIPIFLQRIASDLPLPVYGDGAMVRDYVYVEDVARLIVRATGVETAHPLYNVGSAVGVSLTEILEVMREVTGRQLRIERMPIPSTFVDRVVLDTERYASEFGPYEFVALRDGIERTWHDTLDRNA